MTNWEPERVTEIIGITCDHFTMPRDVLLSGGRSRTVALARAVAMRLCRDEGYSFPEIGRFFGRDHTTVMSACRRVAKLIVAGGSPDARNAWASITKRWAVRRDELMTVRAPEPAKLRVAV